jgi:hypothetical protein
MEMKSKIYHQHDIELARFQRACEQILHLNGKLDEISKRYMFARDNNNKIFRYSLRSRMLVIEGMLTAYCSYAKIKKMEIMKPRHNLGTDSEDEEFSSEDE